MRTKFLSLLTAGVVAGALLPATAASAGLVGSLAAAPQTHVVVLDASVADVAGTAQALAATAGLSVERVYEHALKGFTVTGSSRVIQALELSPLVSYVEADRTFTVTAQSTPFGVDRIDADALGVGSGITTNVDIAVIDTGIDATHPDLNVFRHVNCQGLLGLLAGNGCKTGGSDDNGHGTHVSGTAAAKDNNDSVVGVAPGARLWGVKVLGGVLGTGSTSDVIAGIDYVAANANEIEVANMSLGGSGRSQATDDAIAGATAAGVVVVVAAGNDSADANGFTPANSPKAVTVSAITDLDGRPGALAGGNCSGGDDSFASYSNYGSVVDIAAPGSCVVSTANGGGTTSLSGTSMASPHVAGAAALYIARNSVAKSGNRRNAVLSGLLSTSVSQGSACGFTGGVSGEKLLDLNGC